MKTFNFADAYKASGVGADSESIRLREGPFDQLRKSITTRRAVDLSRLYFALKVPNDIEWFRSAFGSNDTAFSMVDNANEVAALAACLLEAAVEDGVEIAAVAVQALAAAGARVPPVRRELLSNLSLAVAESAIQQRRFNAVVPDRIKLPTKDEASAAIEKVGSAEESEPIVEALRKLSSDSQHAAKSLAEQTRTFASGLVEQMNTLQEQVEMLWWHVGGWSRVVNQPFSTLDLGASAVLAGIDMADLSKSDVGPVAMPAILQRTIWAGREATGGSVTIKAAVGAFTPEDLTLIDVADIVRTVPDVCPVMTAILKAQELAGGDAWHSPFQNVTGLPVDVEFTPLNLAIQVFRERQILTALSRS